MRQITINELQSDVVAWIKQVAVDRQIVILDQGQPVAAIIPFVLSKVAKTLPNREKRISQRSFVAVDSAVYISEMRD